MMYECNDPFLRSQRARSPPSAAACYPQHSSSVCAAGKPPVDYQLFVRSALPLCPATVNHTHQIYIYRYISYMWAPGGAQTLTADVPSPIDLLMIRNPLKDEEPISNHQLWMNINYCNAYKAVDLLQSPFNDRKLFLELESISMVTRVLYHPSWGFIIDYKLSIIYVL